MTDREKDRALGDRAPLRSFGRRRARKLSSRQNDLLVEGLRHYALDMSGRPPTPLTDLFPSATEVWLEVGFGGGEHLLWQAREHPTVGILGCEPFIDGVVKAIDGSLADGIENIRIHADDVRDILHWIPTASIARIFILFPDPWPKKRHTKRRLVNPDLIRELARITRTDGELRLATDIPDYARAMLLAIRKEQSFRWLARQASDWRTRTKDWPETRYEQKATREGRKRYFLRFGRSIQAKCSQ
ncbi:MAG: tRNA (guanosine(46)-N7)-methyltransferase TrmB [Hyphomicrobiaceae bacterium]